MKKIWRTVYLAVITAGLLALAYAPARAVTAKHGMVAAEQPLASQVGVQILKEGGNAVDAAVATAMAVCATNPVSCGPGGGGFMLIYLAHTHKVYALDFRERAPLKFKLSDYERNGKLDEHLLLVGPLAVGVPGQVAGLATALHRFGTMNFSQVAAPAIKLARNGFPCGEHLAHEIVRMAPRLKTAPGLKEIFLNPDGTPKKTGDKIVEPELANTLESLGNHPIKAFYDGSIGRKIAAFVAAKGGRMTDADFTSYKAIWRKPLERPYQGYQVYSMPPPSSGGGQLLEALEILAPGNIAGLGFNSPAYLARLIRTMRQVFMDRAQYYGDPAFVHVPIDFLLSPKHIDEIRRQDFGAHAKLPPKPRDHGTSHLCVIDHEGNVVSLTTTINTAFGSLLMVPKIGIILNNEMDDFSIAPGIPNVYGLLSKGPNSIKPGKRPVSSMTPTIVLKAGKPVLTLGGSGGPTIVTANLQVLLNILDFHLAPPQAVAAPRIHEQANPPVVVIEKAFPESTRKALTEMGYRLRIRPFIGTVQAIEVTPEGLSGAADPRKGGAAVGY